MSPKGNLFLTESVECVLYPYIMLRKAIYLFILFRIQIHFARVSSVYNSVLANFYRNEKFSP